MWSMGLVGARERGKVAWGHKWYYGNFSFGDSGHCVVFFNFCVLLTRFGIYVQVVDADAEGGFGGFVVCLKIDAFGQK